MSRKTFRNIITSEELYEKINSENIKLMEKFLKEKSMRSGDLTIKNYRSDLKIFFTWSLLYNDNINFVKMKKLQISDFFLYCVDTLKWNSSRFSRMKSVLSSFSNFIEKFYGDEEGYENFRNIILRAVDAMPKNDVREKTILKDEQIKDIFEYLEEEEEYQILCWFALAVASGSRFSELLRFTTDIIDLEHTEFQGLFLETLKPIKTKGRTKQGKMLYKYIIKDMFEKRYVSWLKVRQDIMSNNNKDHTFIFINKTGDPATEADARGWVRKIEKRLRIPFYPHAIRHYTATYLSKLGIPYNLIKDLFGWASVDMVSIYDDQTAKDREWKELNNLKENLNK